MNTAPPPGGHSDSNGTNVLTKLHEYWTIIVTSRVLTRKMSQLPGDQLFQRTGTIFKLNLAIIKTNFGEGRTKNVTSRIFKVDQDTVGTYLWTKLHEDQTINVASRVLKSQNVDDGRPTTDNARRTKCDPKSSP
ncbi:hypothetical protein DPMN_023927 [Dreissena polymorpha]|uniref:Uncharacterized protein n=1 Tax=Dreissena polymorpha TaxID=45954 RepID=A0A9D4RAB9_DREPO|nr:hypothetical protein DPMN_023927 [Dreissena polymorpha]